MEIAPYNVMDSAAVPARRSGLYNPKKVKTVGFPEAGLLTHDLPAKQERHESQSRIR
jgi:hypothetical protein